MSRDVSWLKAVPVWVWLFLALSQVLLFAVRAIELPAVNHTVANLEKRSAPLDVKQKCEKVRQKTIRELISASILAPVFIGAVCWSRTSHRSKRSATSLSPLQGPNSASGQPECREFRQE